MDTLSDVLLREEGYSPYYDEGIIAALGISVRRPPGGVAQYIKLTARRIEYVRGTSSDTDAEVVPVAVFKELSMRPLAVNDEDIVDAVRRHHHTMSFPDEVIGTIIATDMGPGEGSLAVEGMRRIPSISNSLFPLRTISDVSAVKPHHTFTPGGGGAWQMNAKALVESLATRATSGQVLVDRDASDDARLALLQGLREAGQTETSENAPLTRIIAWMTEILLRPLVSPVFRISRHAGQQRAASSGAVRIR